MPVAYKNCSRLILVAAILLSGCKQGQGTRIMISGSTTVLPIVSKTAELFVLKNPAVKILVNAGGSGVGINQVAEHTVDIGMISRSISAQEQKKFPKVNFVPHLIGKDAVAVAISAEVYQAGIKTLTLAQIKSIYNGQINNWHEFGDYEQEILVIDKEKSRGTRHVFMQAVFGDKNARADGADLVLGSNNEEQTAIVQSNSAIGMLSVAWLSKDVKSVGVQVDGEVIQPTKENIINGRYPMARELNLVTDGVPSGKVLQFIQFIQGPAGQDIVEELGYVAIQ